MADPSKTIAMAMLVRTIEQTVLPATVQISDPSCNMRVKAVETSTLRWIIIVIGALLLGSIFLFGHPEKKHKPRASRRQEKRRAQRREPTLNSPYKAGDPEAADGKFGTTERGGGTEIGQGELEIGGVQPDSAAEPATPQKPAAPPPEKIVSLFLEARDNHIINGAELLQAAIKTGLEFGEMSIFHRIVEGADKPVFSLADAAKPGTFSRDEWNTFETSGVVLFMTLPGPAYALDAWDSMLTTARRIGEILNTELMDDEHKHFTRQKEARIREEMRAYDRSKS